jgi:UrcA family protein
MEIAGTDAEEQPGETRESKRKGLNMSEKFTSLLAACAVTFVVFAATTPAVAQTRPIVVTGIESDIPVRYVSYRDLNLVQAADERTLVKRVRFAATDVCTDSVSNLATPGYEFIACKSLAWRGAQPQIERAVLRARQIATNGWSAIAPVAISISVR